jgi:hypothetical protein
LNFIWNIYKFLLENDPITNYIKEKRLDELTTPEILDSAYTDFGSSQYFLMQDQVFLPFFKH